MKKFTKGCLITALILLITGCVFCAVFGTMGGFRQIDYTNGNGPYKILKLGGLGNFVLGYNGYNFGIWDADDWDEWDEDEWSENYNMNDVVSSESAVQTSYSVDDITDIDIDLGGENLIIAESEDEYIWIENNSGNNKIKYGKEGRKFKLYSKTGIRLWKNVNITKGSIRLYLPKGLILDSIDMDVGAGKMESSALEADEISLDIGAGEFNIKSIMAREVDISVGAGKVTIENISASEADISVGAGSLDMTGLDAGDLTLEVGMGSIDVEGRISGDADLECGMGNISMKLQGLESEYNYILEAAMGNIRIGDSKYSGLASERRVDNGSRSTFDVECAMGNIEIDFN